MKPKRTQNLIAAAMKRTAMPPALPGEEFEFNNEP